MKVILLKDIEKLGKEGDLLSVKDGYGRNYLIPRSLALPATKENLKKIDRLKETRKKKEEKEAEKVLEIQKKIEELSLTITAEAKEDQTLYGSITENQICKELQGQGLEISKEMIKLEKTITKLGVYKIPVKITAGRDAVLRVWVVKK